MFVARSTAQRSDFASAKASTPRELETQDASDGSAERQATVRTVCLAVITFLLLSHALYVAASVMVPVVAAIVIALALRPVVRRLSQMGLPEIAGAFVALSVATCAVVFLASQLIAPASEWIARTPVKFKLRQLERKLEPIQKPLKSVQEASAEISEAVNKSTSSVAGTPSETPEAVVVKPPSLISEVISSTWQITAGAALCLVLTFFFLAKGETLIERVGSVLPAPSSPDGEPQGIAAVERSVSRYLFTVSVVNACLGICIGVMCRVVGVPNALLWGVMAALLNFLPYIGGLIGAVVILLVSIFSFDSIPYACIAPAAYLCLTAIEGNFVTPAILGRSMSLNPLVVILALTYWTWLWGPGGAVLAVPLLAIFMSTCKQFDATSQLAVILSD